MTYSEPDRKGHKKKNIKAMFDLCDRHKLTVLFNADPKTKQLSIEVVDSKKQTFVSNEFVEKDEYIDDAALRVIDRMNKRKKF